MTKPQEKLLCLATLAQLRQDVGDALLPELVALFNRDSQQNLTRLQQAMVASDLPLLTLQAHTLKSVCATYGAQVCQDQAKALEAAARSGDSEKIAIWVGALSQTLPSTMRALSGWCDEQCAPSDQDTSR